MKMLHQQRKGARLATGMLAAVLVCGLTALAEARAGRGGSFGSRGSRSFSAPARPSTPPGGTFGQRSAPPSTSSQPQQAPFSRSTPFSQSSPFGGGSFLRSVGGGLVGGFLGAMLFRSLGFAGYGAGYGEPGGSGGSGGSGGGWGGPGLFDLLLLGLVGYVAYRFFWRRRSSPESGEPVLA